MKQRELKERLRVIAEHVQNLGIVDKVNEILKKTEKKDLLTHNTGKTQSVRGQSIIVQRFLHGPEMDIHIYSAVNIHFMGDCVFRAITPNYWEDKKGEGYSDCISIRAGDGAPYLLVGYTPGRWEADLDVLYEERADVPQKRLERLKKCFPI